MEGVKISHSCHHAEDTCFHMFGNNMANLVENFDDLFACVGVTIFYWWMSWFGSEAYFTSKDLATFFSFQRRTNSFSVGHPDGVDDQEGRDVDVVIISG